METITQIKTVRLLLRELKQSDWAAISYLRSDLVINELVKRPKAETKEKALVFISKINTGIQNQSMYYWSISEINTSEMIGSICLWNFSADQKTAETGYDLSPKHQGKGIMSEALKSTIEYGFNNLNLDAIEAFTHTDNLSSRRLLEKNRFKLIKGRIDSHNNDNVIYRIENT